MQPNDFSVTLDAVEPMELLRTDKAMSVSVRIDGPPNRDPAGAQPVEIRGAKEDVFSFIATNWGDEEATYQRGYADGYAAATRKFESIVHATITS